MAEINSMEFSQPMAAQQARGSKNLVASELNDGQKVKITKEDPDNTHVTIYDKDGNVLGYTNTNDGRNIDIDIYADGTKIITNYDNKTKTTVRPDGFSKTEKLK